MPQTQQEQEDDFNEILQKNIISMLGIEDLPQERKIELVGKINDLVQHRVFNRMTELLPEENQDEFLEAVAEQQEDKIKQMFSDKGDQMKQIIQEEIVQVKKEFKEEIDNLDL